MRTRLIVWLVFVGLLAFPAIATAQTPTATTGPATAVTPTSATVTGTANAEGDSGVQCFFDWGTDPSDLAAEDQCDQGATLPATSTPDDVSVALLGPPNFPLLSPNTTYFYQLHLIFNGQAFDGSVLQFTTPPNPVVTPGPATNITQTSATLTATVNPEGNSNLQCSFQWGTDPTLDVVTQTPCDQTLGSGTSPVPVTLNLSGLSATTTYYYAVLVEFPGNASPAVFGNPAPLSFSWPPPAPAVVTGAASSISAAGGTLNATVNPNGGSVTSCQFNWGTTSSYGQSLPCDQSVGAGASPVPVTASLSDLTPNTTYHFQIVSTNAGGTTTGLDQTLTTAAVPPTAVTAAPGSISPTGATLNGTVNPNMSSVTTCRFDWGTTSTYGGSVPCAQQAGSGGVPVPVSAVLSGLTPNTTYHYRIVSANGAGTTNGLDQTVTTPAVPPTVVTGAPGSISQTGATLNGTVNPNASSVTTCRFDWGTTSTYGNSVPCAQQAGSGGAPVPVSAVLSGLQPNSTYHYRIVSANGAGTSNGLDQTLTTSAVPPPVGGGSVNVSPVSGTVLVKLPGSRNFILVGGLKQIPLGTIVDATHGVVTVFAAKKRNGQLATGQAWGGVFRITQKRVSGNWLTVLTLSGPKPTGCTTRAAEVARRRARHRALWIRDPGYFMTVGRYASAMDHGTTQWLTEDNCAGTLIKVTRGSVKVNDFPHHRGFVLKARHSFLAHPGRGG